MCLACFNTAWAVKRPNSGEGNNKKPDLALSDNFYTSTSLGNKQKVERHDGQSNATPRMNSSSSM